MTPRPDGPPVPGDLPSGLEIRVETPADHRAVAAVVAAAFGSPTEAELVEAIRPVPEFLPELSLVADVGGHLAGHVMISYATIRDGKVEPPHRHARALGGGPAVPAPRHRIGTRRRGDTSGRRELGSRLVALEGSPIFYGRLGFEYSVPYGIHLSLPSWAPAEAAQVLRLSKLHRVDPAGWSSTRQPLTR